MVLLSSNNTLIEIIEQSVALVRKLSESLGILQCLWRTNWDTNVNERTLKCTYWDENINESTLWTLRTFTESLNCYQLGNKFSAENFGFTRCFRGRQMEKSLTWNASITLIKLTEMVILHQNEIINMPFNNLICSLGEGQAQAQAGMGKMRRVRDFCFWGRFPAGFQPSPP